MTYRELWGMLTPLYGEAEAHAVADYVLDVGFGLSKADVMCGAIESMAAADAARLDMMAARLSQGEPVQYVVGRACFCGRWFGVRPGVLVPRPETEELCALVEADFRGRGPLSVLDVGTGSGCIAVTLALDMPQSRLMTYLSRRSPWRPTTRGCSTPVSRLSAATRSPCSRKARLGTLS